MTHVVIRCDASAEGGIGHLVRALSVADAAQAAGHTAVVAGSIRSPLARRLLREAGLETVGAPADLEVLAAEQGASVVHVDDYAIGDDALAQVRACGALLSSMEDGAYGRRPADVVVDSTLRAERTERPADGSGAVLRGIAYAPMRAQVLAARERRAARTEEVGAEARVLIVMGGTDAMGAAGTVAAVCAAADGIGRISVISPEQNWEAVRAEAGDDVELLAPSPEFLDRACAADLVVSASGTTAWELTCIGVPSLLVAVVENQRAGYEAAIAEGIARGLGSLSEVRDRPRDAVARVEAAVADLRSGQSWAPVGRAKVDGHGAARIVSAWEEALAQRIGEAGSPVVARPATTGDSSLLMRWRNDPATREVSRTSDPVTWSGHTGWYERALADPARELYVAQRGSRPVGTVRFDEVTAAEWEVSITLAPEARGHGLARPVLAAGEAAFARRHPGVTLIAAVLPGNAPSQRLFARAGYLRDPHREDGDFDVLVRRDPS